MGNESTLFDFALKGGQEEVVIFLMQNYKYNEINNNQSNSSKVGKLELAIRSQMWNIARKVTVIIN